ncbi:hypothetical protein [Paenibacillus sp. OAS669]|uniref:hypothetical protein n=1 Tax=Paenibacillus sp. OAS669 TaxID=2663821 RepID=UPI00178990FC|nr:hypothetical protein [Paenibacillus sp. OAS669]MBE1444321.1 hypothetical protein [Paenibacillus sp. OAS669]
MIILNSNRSTELNPLFRPPLLTTLRRRTPTAQSEHDSVVKEIALLNHNNGKYVLADHIQWVHGKPNKIGDIIPDIAIYDNTGITHVEVETMDSLMLGHSISQYQKMNRVKNSIVVLVVPTQYDKNRLYKLVHDFENLYFSNIRLSLKYL